MKMTSAISATSLLPASLSNAISLLDQAATAMSGDVPLARDRISAARDILLGRAIKTHRPNVAKMTGGGLAPWQTKRVIAHIEAHIEETIANDELAELINVSTRHFTRAFRQTFGTTPHAYVLARRVELAAEMMAGSEEKLAVIAAACGFHDQSHLNRIFRRVKGVTPAVWRRRYATFAMANA